MTARVLIFFKSSESLACFRACFLPGWAKDLSAPQYNSSSIKCKNIAWTLKSKESCLSLEADCSYVGMGK